MKHFELGEKVVDVEPRVDASNIVFKVVFRFGEDSEDALPQKYHESEEIKKAKSGYYLIESISNSAHWAIQDPRNLTKFQEF